MRGCLLKLDKLFKNYEQLKNEKNGKLKLTNFSRNQDVAVLLPQFKHVVHTFDTNFSQDSRT